MKARRLLDAASYDPDTLKAMTQAFDEAWAIIAGNFDAASVEAARLRLAHAVLSVTCEDSRDVAVLKRGALEAMALSYADQPFDRVHTDET